MRYRCWMKFHSTEDHGIDIDASDVRYAGGQACDEWNNFGSFAGDPIPSVIEVYVRDMTTRELFLVEVEPEYSVNFYGSKAVPTTEAEVV